MNSGLLHLLKQTRSAGRPVCGGWSDLDEKKEEKTKPAPFGVNLV